MNSGFIGHGLALALLASLLLGIIWVGYPLIMIALAGSRLRVIGRSARVFHDEVPVVSIILATRERAAVIRERVANLLDTEWPSSHLEIVVVLDAATSNSTAEEIRGSLFHNDVPLADNVIVIVGDAPGGKACSLEAGVRNAKGSLLMMADSQQCFRRDTIPTLANSLRDPRMGAVSGALTLNAPKHSPLKIYWDLEKRLRLAEAVVHSAVGVTGAVYMIRRALWPGVPAGTILDDVYVPMAVVLAGHRIGFCPQAIATDLRPIAPETERSRKTRTLTGVIQVCQLLPGVLSPVRNPIWFQFLMHKIMRLLSPGLVVLVGIGVVLLFVESIIRWPLVLLSATAGLTALLLSVASIREVTSDVFRWILAMMLSNSVAIWNGLRGRWNVWTR